MFVSLQLLTHLFRVQPLFSAIPTAFAKVESTWSRIRNGTMISYPCIHIAPFFNSFSSLIREEHFSPGRRRASRAQAAGTRWALNRTRPQFLLQNEQWKREQRPVCNFHQITSHFSSLRHFALFIRAPFTRSSLFIFAAVAGEAGQNELQPPSERMDAVKWWKREWMVLIE